MGRPAAFFLADPTDGGEQREPVSEAGLENLQGAAPIVLRSGPSLLPGKGFKVSS
jgi:hypothetical protein